MSDSTSSDEENECFKEAIEPTLFSNNLYRPIPKNEATAEKFVKLPPSRRNQQDSIKHFNPLEIRVSPGFRTYVSGRLHKLLDSDIDYIEELEPNKGRKLKSKAENKGIKLLRTSNNFLNDSQECDLLQERKQNKNKRKNSREITCSYSSSSSSDEEKRAKEVAVSADWILSGKATEGWAPCTKGQVEFVVVKSAKK